MPIVINFFPKVLQNVTYLVLGIHKLKSMILLTKMILFKFLNSINVILISLNVMILNESFSFLKFNVCACV